MRRPGDDIWVSGTLGDAALGLRVLRGLAVTEDEALALVDRYRTPRPRLALGQGAARPGHRRDRRLRRAGRRSRPHLRGLRRGARPIDASPLPLSPWRAASRVRARRRSTGGDDYELLFTAPPAAAPRLEDLARSLRLPLTRIGRIEGGAGVRVLDRAGAPIELSKLGWRHF